MVKRILSFIVSRRFWQSRSKHRFWKLFTAGLILSFAILGMVTLSIYAQSANSPWPMYQHDPQHTGRSEYLGQQTSQINWTCDIVTTPSSRYPGSSQPVIGTDGTIYLTAGDNRDSSVGELYALNPDGTIKWQLLNLEGRSQTPAIGPDGTIYLLTLRGVVYAINPNGTEKWKFYCEDGGRGITIGPDGTLYVASYPGLYALNPDGAEKWRYQEKYHTVWGENWQQFLEPAIGPDGTIYVVFSGYVTVADCGRGILYALNPDGTVKWKKGLGGYNMGAPSIGSDGTIYVAGTYLYAYDPSDGEMIWKSRIYGNEAAYYYTPSTPIITPDGTIVAGVNYRRFFVSSPPEFFVAAFNPYRERLWIFAPEEDNYGFRDPIVDAEGTVFIPWIMSSAATKELTRIYWIDSADGSVKQTLDIPALFAAYSPLAIGLNGYLYIPFVFSNESYTTLQLKLYCIGSGGMPATGTITGKVTDSSTGNPISGAAVSVNGYSTTTDSNGNYSFSVLEGTYTVTASASGYKSQTKEDISVIAGETVTVNFSLHPVTTGSISGTIFYTGTRTGNIRISAFDAPSFSPSLITSGSPVAEATISTPGPYSITGLPEGSYYLIARLPGGYIGHLGVYSHNPPHGSPTLVSVTAGQDTSNIDITIRDEGSISGTLSYTGAQTGNIYVEASLNSSLSDPLFLVSYGSLHSYSVQFPAVLTWYIFAFIDSNGNGKYDSTEPFGKYGAPDPVTVEPGGDTPNIDITLVGPSENQPPTASFTYSPENPVTGEEVTFDASSSADPDGEIVSYEWDFGDGLTGVGQQTTHSYNKAIAYLVTLLVTDNKGATNTEEISIPVSLYPSEEISTPPSGPPTLEFANLSPEERTRLYKVIKQVLNVEQAKIEREGKHEDVLFNYINILLKQLDPEQKDEDLQEIDIIRENALSETQELFVDFAGAIAGAGITFLTGMPAPFLGEGAKLLGFYIGEKLVLGDISSVTVKYPKIGRIEIVSRPSENKILVNTYLEDPVKQAVFIIIPIEFKPLRILWGTYICSPMWCGITCPPEAALKEPIPKLEDVRIKIVDLHSPGELRVYDSSGKITGLMNGKEKEEIPDSAYVNGTVVIFSPSGSYRYELVGTEEGSYGLEINSVEDGEVTNFTAIDIPILSHGIHQYTIDWDALSEGEEGVTIQIDSDGDGEFDWTGTSGKEFTPENIDTTPPTGSILINSDADYTNSRSVTLNLEATDPSGVSAMCFSNDNSSWSDWEAYATSKSWTLTSGDGTKRVYVKFKDSAGNVSKAYSDTIILDTTPPKVAITSPTANTYVGGTLNITGTATDTHFRKYKLYYGQGENPSSWNLIKESSSSVNKGTLGSWDTTKVTDGSYIIKLWADDKANNSAETKVKILTDNTPPEIKDLTLDQENFISGDYASSTPTILATLTDVGSGIDKETINLRIKSTEGDEIVVPASSISFNSETGEMSYAIIEPLADSEYEVSLGVKDKVGNSAEEKTIEFVVESKLMMKKVLNYPNPLSSGTKFTYILTRDVDEVTIKVYTVAGELVKTIDFASSHVGYNEEEWDGINDYGEELANGTYPYKITVKLGDEKVSKIQMLTVLK